jgi:hypothetical protein
MRRRLDVGGASSSAVASALEVSACRVGHSGLTIVVGQHLWLRLDRRRKVFGQHVGNAAMELLALATQQASVGHVTHERVFEQECCLRRGAPAKHQLSIGEAAERRLHLHVSFLRDGRQRFVRELSPYGGTDLRYLSRNGTEAIKACH